MLQWIKERVVIKVKRVRRTRKVRRTLPFTPEQLVRVEELRREAKAYLPQRVAELAQEYGFSYGRVTIRAARTRWGSCTSSNNLSLSLFLMTLPPHLIDFVLIHELCHTIHHNHSAAFHKEVDRCTGGRERELHAQLRQHRITL